MWAVTANNGFNEVWILHYVQIGFYLKEWKFPRTYGCYNKQSSQLHSLQAIKSCLQVGMGQSPKVPDHLSEEGKNFLGSCFVHNPEERASAEDLLSHNFTKVGLKDFYYFEFLLI